MEISWNRNPYGSDTCTIEYDAGYPWPEAGWEADLSIIFRDVDNIPKVYFKWSGDLNEHLIEDFGRKIVAWDQKYDDQRRRRLRSKDNGNFVFDQPVTISNFPQDSRRDCGNELQQFNHNLSGALSLNLTIDRDVITPSPEILQDFTNRITVLTGSALTVNSGKIFTLNQYSSFANAIIMTIKGVPVYQQQPTGLLSLKNNSQLKVKSTPRITGPDPG